MSFIVIIPARFASQRLPGKPLLDIGGKTMIERVYRCAQKSSASRVIVATDDARIEQAVRAFGGEVMMTSADHASGTDRLHEVATKLGLADNDVVVNVQGDEPLIPAAVIDQVATNLARDSKASAATLSEAIDDVATLFNPNAVKVVCDSNGHALYFSRASIPFERGNYDAVHAALPSQYTAQRHIGIYAYRVSLLNVFVHWPPSDLELCEKLEQLRILSNGHSIHVAVACEPVPGGVDTQEDLNKVRALLAQ